MATRVRFAPTLLALLVPLWLYGLKLCLRLPSDPPGGNRGTRDVALFDELAHAVGGRRSFDYYASGPGGTYWRARFALAPIRLDVKWSQREVLAALEAPDARLLACFADTAERTAFWRQAQDQWRPSSRRPYIRRGKPQRLVSQRVGRNCLQVATVTGRRRAVFP